MRKHDTGPPHDCKECEKEALAAAQDKLNFGTSITRINELGHLHCIRHPHWEKAMSCPECKAPSGQPHHIQCPADTIKAIT